MASKLRLGFAFESSDLVAFAWPFLEASGLVKSYPVGGRPLTVLRDLDLQVEAGEMVAIVGASGVGKSTLLHVLGGLDRADQGTIAIDGAELTTLPAAEVVGFRNRRVGFVFQFHHLLPEFSALENAEMPMRIARMPMAEARARAEELLQRVGLGERLDASARHAVGRRAAARRGRARARHAARRSCWPTSRPATSTSRPPTRCTRCCARCTRPTA